VELYEGLKKLKNMSGDVFKAYWNRTNIENGKLLREHSNESDNQFHTNRYDSN